LFLSSFDVEAQENSLQNEMHPLLSIAAGICCTRTLDF
jgi:hypothetical protein